ncbi:low molecular weight phosphatase family protein [Candidatus Gracilibacteria bacterium]|nr:low molecular weight phosphatase family protein [Candidatus Gracilibacteria bacterium]
MKKYILFICGYNSGRSQMAELYFNTHNANPDIEAKSCGTAIKGDKKINPKIVELLFKKGIDIHNQDRKYTPKMITREMLENAEQVFTMGCLCTDGDILTESQVDYDFCLDDPAKDDTDIDAMFEKFQTQIGPVLKKYNS